MNQSINQAVREMAKSVSGGHAAVAAVHHPRRLRNAALQEAADSIRQGAGAFRAHR